VRRDRKEDPPVSRARDWLVAAAVLVAGRGRKKPLGPARERMLPAEPPSPRAELLVVGLLLAAALFAVAFIVVYALDRLPAQTQFLGLALGLSLGCIAAALIVVAARLVPEEQLEEDYPVAHPAESDEIAQLVEEGGDRFTRKRLVVLAASAAGGALGLAAITPALSLGPALDPDILYSSPWEAGRRLVDERGRPLRADDIEFQTFYTAFPEQASPEDVAAPLVVVRLDPTMLALPQGRAGWAPGGILAYSKICTHAGCAISLFRTPLFPPAEPKPALVCPCHYSTFDPAAGGAVLFGPAGRPLPQLPLRVGVGGLLEAAGNFSGPVGPSWWGIRMGKPT
jgi:ubiquinol-cytochrome c reductase iron-sulfur subunit